MRHAPASDWKAVARSRRRGWPMLSLALVCVANATFATDTNSERQPSITLSPAHLVLETPPKLASQEQDRTVYFKLTNTTGVAQRFCKFYLCWAPLIMSEDGEVHGLGFTRDATRGGTLRDYPVLQPGKSATLANGCEFKMEGDVLIMVLGDFVGGVASFELHPGTYKLCISYHFSPTGPDAIPLSFLHLSPEQIYSGWVMSNWISIKVLPPPVGKAKAGKARSDGHFLRRDS